MLDAATLSILTQKFLVGTLIFIRIMGIFLMAPFLSSEAIIAQVKIGLGVILAMMVTSAYWTQQPVIEFHLWYLVLLVLKEIMVGMLIGFSCHMVFYAARFAGGLVDFDMGFQTSMMFDMNNQTPTLLGEFKELIVLMLFFILNGHHHLIEAIYVSMKAVPLTTFAITDTTIHFLIKFSTSVLMVGIKIAAPVLVASFLTNLALALMARIAPQTNIFMLSFQVKITVGLFILFVSVPLLVYVLKIALAGMQVESYNIIMSLNPAAVP